MKVQDENARRSSMLVVCRKISSAVWKIFSTEKKFFYGPSNWIRYFCALCGSEEVGYGV